MDEKAVTVFFKGETKDLNDAVSQAKATLTSFGSQLKDMFGKADTKELQASLDDVGETAEKSKGGFDTLKSAGASAKSTLEGVTLGIGAFAVAATAFLLTTGALATAFADQIRSASDAFDQTSESMGALKSVADRSGVSLQELGKSFFDLQSNAESGDAATVAALSAIGLKANDVAGLTQDALAVKMADAFSGAAESSNKAATAVALFGADVASKLVPQLDQGAAHMRDLEGAADRAGVVIGQDLMDRLAGTSREFDAMKDAIQELKSTFQGMTLQGFDAMKGAIDGLIQSFTDVIRNVTSAIEAISDLGGSARKNAQATGFMTEATNQFAGAIVEAIVYVEEMAVRGVQYVESLGVAFGDLSAVAAAFGNDVKAMSSVSAAALYTAYETAIQGIERLFGDLASTGKSAMSFDLSGVRSGFSQLGQDADAMGAKLKAALSPTYFAGTSNALAAMKNDAKAEAAALDTVIAKLEAQKAAQLAIIASGGAKSPVAGTKAVGDPSPPDDDDKGKKDTATAGIAAIEGEIEVARKALAQKEELYAADLRLKIFSESEKLAKSKTALDDEYTAEKALLNKELQLSGLSEEQKAHSLAKLKELDQKYANDTQKIMIEAAEQSAEPWFKMVDSISSSLSSSIVGMIEHTKTLRDALRGIAQSITQDFVKMGVDVLADWAKKQIGMAALSVAGEQAKTTATATGTVARESISIAGMASESVAFLAHVGAQIAAMAAQAFAGVTAFLAPVLGPGAVGPAAGVEATVLAAGAGIGGSFAVGAWSLPNDMIAQVHAGEMIVPAAQTPWAQSLMANAAGAGQGNGGDTTVHLNLNVQAWDQGSVKGWLAQGGARQIAKALNDHLPNNPSLRR